MTNRKYVAVSEDTHDGVEALRAGLEATRGTPTTAGDAVAHAVRVSGRHAHVVLATLGYVLGAVVPEVAGGAVSYRGIKTDAEKQTITVQFWGDTDDLVVPVGPLE